jgi:hypothetical protein
MQIAVVLSVLVACNPGTGVGEPRPRRKRGCRNRSTPRIIFHYSSERLPRVRPLRRAASSTLRRGFMLGTLARSGARVI